MLVLNVERLLRLRGIDQPYKYLVRSGFIPQTATNMINKKVVLLHPAKLTRLCHMLNCTPNDLFEWHDDGKTVLHDTHALRTLKRAAPTTNVQSALRNLPLDKLEKLGEIIAQLDNGAESDGKI